MFPRHQREYGKEGEEPTSRKREEHSEDVDSNNAPQCDPYRTSRIAGHGKRDRHKNQNSICGLVRIAEYSAPCRARVFLQDTGSIVRDSANRREQPTKDHCQHDDPEPALCCNNIFDKEIDQDHLSKVRRLVHRMPNVNRVKCRYDTHA